MFLAATDNCDHCGGSIYPDDEKVGHGLAQYHFECAEASDLPEEDSEE